MKCYQIHDINGENVHLLNLSAKTKCNGVLLVKGNNVQISINSQKYPETIKGVFQDPNDLAPISVGGVPFVYTDRQLGLVCPMEDVMKSISDYHTLKVGDYLITE